ncbi:MAG: hypothetical protein CMJ28_02080 [Phycisphaerae bacterium]|nr:hypothetical protein [Phycisphaerae bacterium]
MRFFMLLTLLPLAACSFHKPGGTLFQGTGDTTTIESTERLQKSVTLVDIRSGEVLVSIDVPVGKQLTWDIVPGMGKDPVESPDLMRWQIWDLGTRSGSMQNALSVPNAASVRIDIDARQGVAYAEGPPELTPRSDRPVAPEWWRRESGSMPSSRDRPDRYAPIDRAN